jgi:hypothetical protein
MLLGPRFKGVMDPVLERYSPWERRQFLKRSARMDIIGYQPLGGSLPRDIPIVNA